MREMMWIFAVLILLLSEACRLEAVARDSAFNVRSDVNLTCSNKTWNETIFVIWKINLKHKVCRIAFSSDGRSDDSCNDGKSLRNTSSAQSYLHIPNFSGDDVGIYKCEFVYNGGSENYEINVAIKVPPNISAWLEQGDNKMVAVCKAERGKPAANISWNHMGNTVERLFESNDLFTVESRLELLDKMEPENLSCVIKHPYWREEKILMPKPIKGYVSWVCILVVVILFLAGFSFFAQKKLILRRCQQPNISPPKLAPKDDVEDVEPYISYVQRVNSIYNSSADLFT